MGKKRRYIQRASKFGKKMFNFLDKLDGIRDSTLKSTKLDTVLTEINLIDRGNQTFSVSFEAMGPGDPVSTNSLQGDRVTYTIDGAAVNADHIQTFGVRAGLAANDRDNFITTAFAPARAGSGGGSVLLAPGTYEIEAHIIKEGSTVAVSKKVKKTFNIARSAITFGTPLDLYLREGSANGNVQINLAKLNGKITGKQPGDEVTYDPGTVHGYKIEVLKDVDGTLTPQIIKNALTATNNDTFFLVLDGAGADVTDDMLQTAVVANTTFTIRLTAVGTDGVALVDSFDHTISITV
jgi:hypothetical protein